MVDTNAARAKIARRRHARLSGPVLSIPRFAGARHFAIDPEPGPSCAEHRPYREPTVSLISVERALAMVDGSFESGLQALRRLPELGRDDAERARLEAFLNAVLEEFKRGAAESAAPFRS